MDVNQQLLQSLCRLPDTQVLLISPTTWISDFSNEPILPKELPDPLFTMIRRPIVFAGKINLHFYPQFPRAEIRAFAPDIIYSTQEPFSLSNYQALSLSQQLKKPFVFHSNQNILKSYPPPFSWVEAKSFREADYALAYSQEASDVMAKKGRTRPSAVVPYATDVSLFLPNPEDKRAVRAAFQIGEQDIVFGFLGRLVSGEGDC